MGNGRFDGIVLGTGHNALVLQAYLCRCGLRVLSLDRRVLGGGLATVENPRHPGFRHNTHSFFHRAATVMPWYRDLELERHGARYLEPELNVAMLLRDGRSLEWWTDLQRTIDSCAAFSAEDAAQLHRWAEDFGPIVDGILIPEAQSPPLSPELRQRLLSRSALGRKLLATARLSPLEFVQQEFESDAVRAGLLFFNGLREVDLRLAGFGHSIPALLASRHKAQMCLGGSAKLAEALAADIREHGGEIRTQVSIRCLLSRQGRVTGVELENGERIEDCAFVASGLNPQQTFLELLPDDQAPAPVRVQAQKFGYNLIAPLFALNLALREPPHYRAAAHRPEIDRAFMVILGLEGLEQFHQIVEAHEAGEIPPTVMWGATPTIFDPSQAPPEHHTAFMWEKLPYAVHGNPDQWDAIQDTHGRQMLELWSQYAPNLSHGSVIDSFTRTPLDVERTLPNMRYGDLLVGSFANGQVGYNRPFADAGQYRTPVPGLYVCGGSTHPGGNITGLCGYNAARIVAADLGLPIWWSPPDIEAVLAAL
ncbi:MAG: NAD(P)/FAD-dependent oxidoreductase [Bryobacteraceae bacterium]